MIRSQPPTFPRARSRGTSGRGARIVWRPLLVLVAAVTALTPRLEASPDTGGRAARWLPDEASIRSLPADLRSRLAKSPYAYFRYVGRPWAQAVCDAFRDEIPAWPLVQLHGDAHVEQYAVTATAYGLDDFDDSAEGPSVVDLVRFVGSIDLGADARGWSGSRDRVIDGFFSGYYRALKDLSYEPVVPAVVARLRPRTGRDRPTFLAWAESLMQPVSPETARDAQESLDLIVGLLRKVRPRLTPEFGRLKAIGLVTIGIGSRLTPKMLMRVEGPSPAPGDDVILEAKQLSDLSGVDCLGHEHLGSVLRVLDGVDQVGRLQHSVLMVVPRLPSDPPEVLERWIRSWDPTYGEVGIDDLASVQEFVELAHDAGAQLGHAITSGRIRSLTMDMRRRQLTVTSRAEPRIRALAHRMSLDVVEAWRRLDEDSGRARDDATAPVTPPE